MRTYELKKLPGLPLYEALYRCLRQDILTGVLAPGQKLPSKRALAENLKVSKITVETAYNQLLSEGYLRSREKVGYFVEDTTPLVVPSNPSAASVLEPPGITAGLDLTANEAAHFPFSVWSRLQREVLLDAADALLRPIPPQGCLSLRQAIADHLSGFRGMQVSPENILIGAGTDFLYNLLIQLLGRDKVYAVEEPGYRKIRQIYQAAGVRCTSAKMDAHGVIPEALADARVLHISPSHHFPSGIVTPVSRRTALLNWAQSCGGYIIEDDYDSEFRFHAHPLPSLQALDRSGRVIYMNTFSKSLAPSIRVGFVVLPDGLLQQFRETLGFYRCTVSSFEQYTLARFLQEGHFEKHINRMRKFYRARRDRVLSCLESCPWADRVRILEEDAGLHFLMEVDTPLSDHALCDCFSQAGITIRPLSQYYHDSRQDRHCLLVNYSGLEEAELPRLQSVSF